MDDIIKKIKYNRMKLMQLLIIIIFGTSSIWLSALFGGLDLKATSLGFITIVISSMAPTCAEKILSLIGSNKKFEVFVNFVITIMYFVICFVVIALINNDNKLFALIVSLSSYVSYPFVWWYQNLDNKILDESTDALGGGLIQFN